MFSFVVTVICVGSDYNIVDQEFDRRQKDKESKKLPVEHQIQPRMSCSYRWLCQTYCQQ
jgi:outer membrane receptor for Fe3+-dicitrate